MKNLLCLFFVYFIDVWSSKAFDTRGSLSTRESDVDTERLKTNGTAIKITIKTANNQWKKYNPVKIYRNIQKYTETTIFIHEDKY